VGINLSAHALAPAIAQAGLDRLIDYLAEQFRHAGEQNRLAFMLLPHDLKSQSGDVPMLQALKEALQQKGFTHVRYTLIDQPDKIKRLTRFLDLVITGRMHLVIASLGSGTPALSITYQDKFEGLYQHFDLSLEHTITPMQCLSDKLLRKINDAFMHRHDNRARILSRLPRVNALASRNLAISTCDPAE
jgi:polysaccharide pyruvyl transferase WcaK-like protein